MLGLWKKPEKRASSGSYTDQIIAAIHGAAAGLEASVQTSAAAEVAAGLWARAFQSAKVSGPARMIEPIRPRVLAQIGRDLIRRGESIWAIRVTPEGRVRLLLAADVDIWGEADPETWQYRMSLFGPSSTETLRLEASMALHFRFGANPVRPYRGISPLTFASGTAGLLANSTARLAQEAGGPVANLIPLPVDSGKDPKISAMRDAIKTLKGGVGIVPTTAGGWQQGKGEAPRFDWRPERLGANPPAALVEALGEAGREVLAACGIPASMVNPTSSAGAAREGYRQFIHGNIAGAAADVADELSEKLEAPIRLDFAELRAADIASRARAYASLVAAEMDKSTAAKFAGFEE